jgi:hypothetical protein
MYSATTFGWTPRDWCIERMDISLRRFPSALCCRYLSSICPGTRGALCRGVVIRSPWLSFSAWLAVHWGRRMVKPLHRDHAGHAAGDGRTPCATGFKGPLQLND